MHLFPALYAPTAHTSHRISAAAVQLVRGSKPGAHAVVHGVHVCWFEPVVKSTPAVQDSHILSDSRVGRPSCRLPASHVEIGRQSVLCVLFPTYFVNSRNRQALWSRHSRSVEVVAAAYSYSKSPLHAWLNDWHMVFLDALHATATNSESVHVEHAEHSRSEVSVIFTCSNSLLAHLLYVWQTPFLSRVGVTAANVTSISHLVVGLQLDCPFSSEYSVTPLQFLHTVSLSAFGGWTW